MLRDICRVSGVHLYSQQDAFLDATENYVSITATDVPLYKVIRLPDRYTVYDVTNRRILGSGIGAFVADVSARTTVLYFVGSDGEVSNFISALN